MKKLVLFAVLLCLLSVPGAAGVLDNGYAMVGGGAFGTPDQIKVGDIHGFAIASGLVPLYLNSKLLGRVSFANLNSEKEVESYTGSVMLMSRNVASNLINPYAFTALSLTHEAESNDPNSFGMDGGIGLMWELIGGHWYGEAGYKNIAGDASFGLSLGLVFDLNKPAEKQ